ncbi:MAG: leucyl aminopeptidase family protein [Bacteroidales bacterium]|nr:leucyl aminopeptidase family protein [Bacteroidales bacterium]
MNIKITKIKEIQVDLPVIYLAEKEEDLINLSFSPSEFEYIKTQTSDKKANIKINSYPKWSYIAWVNTEKEQHIVKEKLRREAGKLYSDIKLNKHSKILVVDLCNNAEYTLAFTEGLALSHYQFLKYYSDPVEKKNHLEEILIYNTLVDDKQISELNFLLESVYSTKDLVNEPVSFLNADQLSLEIKKLGETAGFEVEVFNKKKIESLKMNGLLAVNKGSIDPPTFTILTWKPDNAVNKNPFVLVGKGVVYDTGGLNIKTGNYMDNMKSDMAGAAAVAGTIHSITKAKLPVYVIGLVPATDNRPNGNAYASDDIITMHSGTTVEVKNTDAEGRLILADALSFAKKFKPELVIDLATLTGSAHAAIGDLGIVAMSNVKDDHFEQLKISGNNVYERIVEFPIWEEYDEMLKSDIADIKNIGGTEAGAITAAKFLEHFTDYPWIHLDIAGPAFLTKHDNYRGIGATAVGVRLLFNFFRNQQ